VYEDCGARRRKLPHGRREFEWKVTLGFWAILAAAIAFVQHDQQGIVAKAIPHWFVAVGVVGFAFLWLRPIWVANDNDKSMAHHFLFEAERIMGDPGHGPRPHPSKISVASLKWWAGFLTDWSAWFQLATTSFLAIILYLILPNSN
jgi:hypothetical protein